MTTEKYLALPYTMIVRWNPSDEVFVARVKEIEGCTGHGDSEADALLMLRDNLREWFALCLANNEPIPLPVECDVLPSGKWLQRVPRTLHKQLIECAGREGVSLNTYVTTCLARSVGAADAKGKSHYGAITTLGASAEVATAHPLLDFVSPYPMYGVAAVTVTGRHVANIVPCEPLSLGVVRMGPISGWGEGAPCSVFLDSVAGRLPNHSTQTSERVDREEEEKYRSRAYA